MRPRPRKPRAERAEPRASAAIERAHAALAAGDEAGCNAALQEARNL